MQLGYIGPKYLNKKPKEQDLEHISEIVGQLRTKIEFEDRGIYATSLLTGWIPLTAWTSLMSEWEAAKSITFQTNCPQWDLSNSGRF